MPRIHDQRTLEVFETRFCNGVPDGVSTEAHEIMRLLMAACDLQDVGVIGRIHVLRDAGRFALHVEGKWFVTFEWQASFGAREVLLERRKEKD